MALRSAPRDDNELDVAIIGAGFGGLIAAQILTRGGRNVTVFEQDANATARPVSRFFPIRSSSGLWALEQAGLAIEYRRRAQPISHHLRILDKIGTLHWNADNPLDGDADSGIARNALRSLLLEGLPAGTVRFGHMLESVTLEASAFPTIHFADGAVRRARFVIGADGPRSRVRRCLTDQRNIYRGVSFIELRITTTHATLSCSNRLEANNSFFALSDNKALLAYANPDGTISIYAVFTVSEDKWSTLGIAFTDPAATRAAIAAQFADWSPEISELLNAVDSTFEPRTVKTLPTHLTWQSQAHTTLIGDAAHLTSPLARLGANIAMQDGAALALALLQHENSTRAVDQYEQEMHARAQRTSARSEMMLQRMMGQQAAASLANFFQNDAAQIP